MSQQIIISIPDNNKVLSETITESLIAVRYALKDILKESQSHMIDRYLQQVIPQLLPHWSIENCQNTLQLGILEPDEFLTDKLRQGLNEDQEPTSQITDGWRSYIANVDLRPHTYTQSSISMTKSHFSHNHNYLSQSKVHVRVEQIKRKSMMVFQPYEPEMINMGKPIEEDPFENGLRQNFEREQQLKFLKYQAEQQRIIEKKEQQKQLRILASNMFGGDKAFTFDNEGRFMIQNIPKSESLVPMQFKPKCEVKFQEKNQKVEFGKSFMHNEIKADKLKTQKQDIQYQTKYDISLIDQIDVAKGVSIHEGLHSKQGPSFSNDYLRHLNRDTLQTKLQNPNISLQLTRDEYQTLVQGGVKYQKQVQLQDTSISTLRQQESFMKEGSKKRVNSSMDSSIMGGAIKVNNESQLTVEELIIQDEQEDMEQGNFKQKNILPRLKNVPTQPDIDAANRILNIGKEAIKQGRPRLPKQMGTHHSFPSLPKNSRTRILSQGAINLQNYNNALKRLIVK